MKKQAFRTVSDLENDNYDVVVLDLKPVECNGHIEWTYVRHYYNGIYHSSFWYEQSPKDYLKGYFLVRDY